MCGQCLSYIIFFFSSRRRHTRCALVTGVQTCALPIYAETDLSGQPHPCELTGALVIDRARGLGFCGLSERCDEAGARLMHDAFCLRATLLFDLAPGDYHTNVVLAVLSGRAALVCPGGLADHAAVEPIAGLYAPPVARLSPAEHRSDETPFEIQHVI